MLTFLEKQTNEISSDARYNVVVYNVLPRCLWLKL